MCSFIRWYSFSFVFDVLHHTLSVFSFHSITSLRSYVLFRENIQSSSFSSKTYILPFLNSSFIREYFVSVIFMFYTFYITDFSLWVIYFICCLIYVDFSLSHLNFRLDFCMCFDFSLIHLIFHLDLLNLFYILYFLYLLYFLYFSTSTCLTLSPL